MALNRAPFGMDMFATYVLGGYLFYAAPHLLWAIVAALARSTNIVWHAGFIASSIALAAISVLWFFPGDPSGLPLQWMLYWPLAIVLQVVGVGIAVLYRRTKAPNTSFKQNA